MSVGIEGQGEEAASLVTVEFLHSWIMISTFATGLAKIDKAIFNQKVCIAIYIYKITLLS